MRVSSLADLNRRNALLHGPRTALVFDGRPITYSALDRAGRALAQAWHGAGLRKGDRVAIVARNRPEVLMTFVACELAGYVAVPLNHRLAAAELAAICRDCEPRLLLHEALFEAAASAAVAASGAVEATDFASPRFAQWLACEPGDATAEGTVAPADLGYLIYTSGTTGKPKGVMLSQAALAVTARNMALETGAQQDDRLAAVMPLFHIGARCKLLAYAWRGASTLLVESFDVSAFLDQVQEQGVTALHLAPSMLQRVIEEQEARPRRLAALRAIHYAAAPMPEPVLRRALALFGPVFRQYYGMTETGAGGTVLQPADHDLDAGADPSRLRSAGQASADADVRVVRDDGSEAALGEEGEVEIRGDASMSGYWRNPQAAADAWHDGWIRTGDVARFDAQRYLYILDRKKDMIVSGGENIYPREVEEALLAHAQVAEAAVIGVPDERWGEAVVAFVVPRAGSHPTGAELIDHCKQRIASFKKPRQVRIVAQLPKNATGKVDKKALRAPFWAGQDRRV